MGNRGRPGPGWHKLGVAVYEHDSGLRIHVHGLAVLPDGRQIFGTHWPESKRMYWFIAVNGGCRRRGVMAWAQAWETTQRGNT